MQRIFQVACLSSLLCLLSINANAASLSLLGGVNSGTGLSPNGTGIFFGTEIEQLQMTVGYGILAKNQQLGHPLSASLVFLGQHLYWGGSLSHYQGSGNRTVEYSGGFVEKDVSVKWDIWFAHAIVGVQIENAIFPYFIDGGFAKGIVSQIDRQEESTQFSNLGRPTGIVVDDVYIFRRSSAGMNDIGPFIRVGIMYKFNGKLP